MPEGFQYADLFDTYYGESAVGPRSRTATYGTPA
jgi:hypothetical protein